MSKSALDSAFTKFQEKKYEDAAKAFGKILDTGDLPSWQKSRIEQYKLMAERAAEPADKNQPPSVREVSFLMNRGDYKGAKAVLKKLDIPDGGTDYLMAEIAAEEEDMDSAVKHLKKAIEASSHNRGYALNSPSWAPHLNKEELAFLREDADHK